MAFEEDKQAAKDTLLAPTDKRVDMYRNCLIELKAALTNEQWNPNPYEIRPTVPAPGELDFLEEREAFRRAQFAAFLHILHTDNMGLWFKFPEHLLAKIRCGEETRTPDPTFVSLVRYLEATLLLNERCYDEEWKARIAEYFECRWPEYRGERVNQALIDRWMDGLARPPALAEAARAVTV